VHRQEDDVAHRAVLPKMEVLSHSQCVVKRVIKSTCDVQKTMAVLLDCNILNRVLEFVQSWKRSKRSSVEPERLELAFLELCATTRLLSSCADLVAVDVAFRLLKRFRADVSGPLGVANSSCVVYYGSTGVSAPQICGAAAQGDMLEVRQQLAAGASVNCVDNGAQRSALGWACAQGHVQVANLLITMQADVNQQSGDFSGSGALITRYNQWTPLHLAAAHGNSAELVQLLLKGRADVNGARFNQTPTPLNLTLKKGNGRGSKVVELLKQSGGHF